MAASLVINNENNPMKIDDIQLQEITRVSHWSIILKEEVMKEDI